MPLSALRHVAVDHCVPLTEIAPLLVSLTRAPAGEPGAPPVSTRMETEVNIAREGNALEGGILQWGEPSIYACPECHGVLLQLKEGSNLRFRCHTGHAYSGETLLAAFAEQTEATLWGALRSLEESVLLMRRLAVHLAAHQHHGVAEALQKKAQETLQRADLVRQAVRGDAQPSLANVGQPEQTT
jgi:two-component system chemotaxis response regulator CheB